MSAFSYAKLPVFQYHTFDRKSVQFTNIPVWRPATPPLVEETHETENVPPEAPKGQADEELVGDEQAGDDAGKQSRYPYISREVILITAS